MSKKLIIIGAGGHGRVVADIAAKSGYTEIAFLDDNTSESHSAYPVIGVSGDAEKYPEHDFFVAIGASDVRKRLQDKLSENGLRIATLIHPNAVIGENVTIGDGTAIMACAVVNPNTTIGKGCIVNTCASVDHDSSLGDFSHVSAGSHLAGTVYIGSRTFIGAGTTIINNITICDDVLIGAGTVVIRDINESGTYIGVPARKLK